jgi:cytochrome d ubiquinol oxidase subunit I
VTLVASLGVIVSGDLQGKVMTEVQPMKMAAAEALYETRDTCAVLVFTIGSSTAPTPSRSSRSRPAGFLGTGSSSRDRGHQRRCAPRLIAKYGSDSPSPRTRPTPYILVTYWSFRS